MAIRRQWQRQRQRHEDGRLNMVLIVVLSIAALILAALIGQPLWRARRRRRLRSQPLSTQWRAIVENALPLCARLSPQLRMRLEGLIQQFMAEKQFVGCRGLAVTPEMKLTVAAHACLLMLNRPGELYPALFSVLLYPDAFIVPEEQQDEAGVVTLHESVLSGEAWETQRIILSWADILSGRAEADGYNVTLHEFAHYLDAEDGGQQTSRLPIMTEEYAKLRAAAEHGEPTLLDPYGAEDPAEFFAVVTETFFELPARLEQQHPALYGECVRYYRFDPQRGA